MVHTPEQKVKIVTKYIKESYNCDVCGKEINENNGIYFLQHRFFIKRVYYNLFIPESTLLKKYEKHFCSQECLVKFATEFNPRSINGDN